MTRCIAVAASVLLGLTTLVGASAAAGSPLPVGLDDNFGNHGAVVLPEGSGDGLYDVTVLPDGRIIGIGYVLSPSGWDFTVIRLLPDGALDPAFGADGVAITSLTAGHDVATGVVVDADGRILVSGSLNIVPNNPVYHGAVARYTTAGSLDSTFATSGLLDFVPPYQDPDPAGAIVPAMPRLSSNTSFYSIAAAPDGSIVVGGKQIGSRAFLAKFSSSGVLDATFGSGGIAFLPFDTTSDVTVTDDGRIIFGASVDGNLYVARWTSDGHEDTSFDGDGVAYAPFAGTEAIGGIAPFEGGVVAVGTTTVGGVPSIALARFSSTGALATDFGGTGMITPRISDDPADMEQGTGIAVDDAERIIVVAQSTPADESMSTAYALRLDANGALDPTLGFDNDSSPTGSYAPARLAPIGIVRLWYGGVTKVVAQSDGRAIAVGNECSSTCSIVFARTGPTTPSPARPELAATGADPALAGVIAIALLAAGGTVIAGRRSRGRIVSRQ